MFAVIATNSCAEVFQASPRCLVRDRAVARKDVGAPVVLVRRSGRPVDEVAAELALDVRYSLGAEKRVEMALLRQKRLS
jgi:hypothetical protein